MEGLVDDQKAGQSWYTVNQAAKRLGVSARTVQNLITRGRFPGAWKVDPQAARSSWRIPREDLERFEDDRKRLG